MDLKKEAFGSLLKIDFCGESPSINIQEKCISMVEEFEKKYSRFREDTFLYSLNKNKELTGDEEFLDILGIAKKVSSETENYFDITLLPLLENKGYGIEKEYQKENIGMDYIEINKFHIRLKNDIQIDLGGIGKGYIIDKIDQFLQKQGLEKYIINFGGDIKVKGNHCIGLEDPCNDKKIIGEIWICDESICASSGRKRSFNGSHHIINPYDRKSQEDKMIVYTKHKKTVYADTYATALFASPLEKSLQFLEKLDGLKGLIIDQNGAMYKSSGFDCHLF